jgi:uncharacterized membrane protein YhfC
MKISPWIILPDFVMIAMSLAFIIFTRRNKGPWSYLGLGALLWVLTVAIKYFVAVPVNPLVYRVLFRPDVLWAPGNVLFYIYVGLLTGLTEVLLTWLLLRNTRIGAVPWAKALAFGVGFGAFEAFLLGFASLATHVSALIATQPIPEATLSGLLLLNNPLFGFAPVFERFGTIWVHIFCCVLLFYAVTSNQVRWFWLSFAYKSLLDAVVAFAQFWGTETLPKLWVIGALVLAFGCLAWWGTAQVSRRFHQAQTTHPGLQPVHA